MAGGRDKPSQVSGLFAQAISAGDLDGALSLWSPAAVIVAPDGDVPGEGGLQILIDRLCPEASS